MPRVAGERSLSELVFIAGSSHSGSTLLDFLLSGHSRFVGLGEIANVIRDDDWGLPETRRRRCSCGRPMAECPFWGAFDRRLPTTSEHSFDRRYRLVLDTFREVFGSDRTPVDSSKYLPHVLRAGAIADLRVLHIVKDVRAFTVSQIDNARRKGRRRRSPDLRPASLFRRWYRENRKLSRVLAERDIPHLLVGYEELWGR
jgi:hypothetical protein